MELKLIMLGCWAVWGPGEGGLTCLAQIEIASLSVAATFTREGSLLQIYYDVER